MKSKLLQKQLRIAFGTSDLRDLDAVLAYAGKAAASGKVPNGFSARLQKLLALVDASYRGLESARERNAETPIERSIERLAALSIDHLWALDAELRHFIPQGNADPRWRGPAGVRPWEAPWAALEPERWAAQRAVYEARQPFRDFEFRKVEPDGSVTWISASGEPLFNEAGEFLGYHGVDRDITARKLEEEKLRAAQDRAQIEVSSARDAIYEWDLSSNTVSIADSAWTMLGYAVGELPATLETFTELTHPDDRHLVGEAFRALLAGSREDRTVEARRRTKDGTYRWHLIRAKADFRAASARPHRIVGWFRDVTQRKLGEGALRASEARYRALVNLLSDIYWETDAELRFVKIEGAQAAGKQSFLGLHPWELVGEGAIRSEHRALYERHEPFRDLELRVRQPDGQWRWRRITGQPSFGEDGRFTGYQGMIRDVTEQKRAQEEHRATAERLSLAFEAAQDGFWDRDVDTGGVYMSPACFTMLGYTPDEIPHTTEAWDALMHPDDLPVLQASRAALSAGTQEVIWNELRRRAKDGRWLWIQARGRVAQRHPDGRAKRVVVNFREVTERRQAEEALRESEERLKLAFVAAQDGFLDSDRDKGVLYMSPACYEMLGYEPGELSETLSGWDSLVHPEDLPRIEASRVVLASGANVVANEVRRRAKDGSWRWIETRSRVVQRRADGSPRRIIVNVRDIHARRLAEQALREREERLKLAYDAAQDGLYDGSLLTGDAYYSPACFRMLGYEPGELPPDCTEFRDLVHPDDLHLLRAARARIAGGEREAFKFEARYRAKDGSWRWVESRVHGSGHDANGHATRIVANRRDITDRKRAEQALRVSEERFKLALDAAQDGLFERRLDGGDPYYSPACARMLGYRPEELGTSLKAWDAIVHPDDRERTRVGRVALHSGERTFVEFEIRRRAKDGSWRWIQSRARAVEWDDQGRPLRIISNWRDVTDQRNAHEELRRAKEAAEAASLAKSEFLANMSHEIRTPMNGILGMTQLALGTALSAEQRDYVETVQQSAESLLAIVNDILDFSKIEAGRLDLEWVPFRVASVVGETVKMLATEAHEKGLEIGYIVESDVPGEVIADPTRLRQILSNLIGNAVKFTHQGGVMVRCRRQSASGDAKHVQLEFLVTDTGIGIAPDLHEKIFDAFTQADSSTTRRYGGTGLGLSICARLARLMGGDISLRSKPGEGSTFTFRISCRPSSSPEARPEAQLQLPAGCGPALVLSEQATSMAVVQHVLAGAGLQTGATSRLADAVRLLGQPMATGKRVQFAIVDADLREGDGIDAARVISAGGRLPVIVLLRISDFVERAARCHSVGLTTVVAKPVSPGALIEAIRKALGLGPGADATAGIAPAQSANGTALNILLAEDNVVNQKLALRMLERLGHRVTLAGNGEEAVELATRQRFDAIFMDVQMPVLGGIDATRAIRAHEKATGAPAVPVIALTALAMQGDREQCLDAGMTDYLAKPVRMSELAGVLEKIGGHRHVTTDRV